MAKFQTRSIFTFTDELSGEQVEQTEEPTTFKIKLVGDSATYEKIMSLENEQRFTEWLKNDGASLVGEYQGRIDELERQIENLQSNNRRTRSSGATAKRDPEQLRAMRQWLSDNGYKVGDRGRIPADLEQAYNSKTPSSQTQEQADA